MGRGRATQRGYVRTLRRLALRALALAGRLPWLALVCVRCGLAMNSSPRPSGGQVLGLLESTSLTLLEISEKPHAARPSRSADALHRHCITYNAPWSATSCRAVN